jgi:hypothetical protein
MTSITRAAGTGRPAISAWTGQTRETGENGLSMTTRIGLLGQDAQDWTTGTDSQDRITVKQPNRIARTAQYMYIVVFTIDMHLWLLCRCFLSYGSLINLPSRRHLFANSKTVPFASCLVFFYRNRSSTYISLSVLGA